MRHSTVVLLLLLSTSLWAQGKSLFIGSDKLDSCLVDLPLDYASKNEKRLQAAARELADIELVHLISNKKTGVTYTRVYVVIERTPAGSTFVFLESPADHKRTSGSKQALFLKYEPKNQRFYRASCFDAVLSDDAELRTLLKEH
jgi:hypothetical protein